MFQEHRTYFRELREAISAVLATDRDGKPVRDFLRKWTARGAPWGDSDAVARLASAPNRVVVISCHKYATFLPGYDASASRRWLQDRGIHDDGFAAANLILRDWPADLPQWNPDGGDRER